MSDNFLILYEFILEIWTVVSLNKVRKLHLHDVYPVNYEDRKVDGMQFRPLPPEISDISGSSQP